MSELPVGADSRRGREGIPVLQTWTCHKMGGGINVGPRPPTGQATKKTWFGHRYKRRWHVVTPSTHLFTKPLVRLLFFEKDPRSDPYYTLLYVAAQNLSTKGFAVLCGQVMRSNGCIVRPRAIAFMHSKTILRVPLIKPPHQPVSRYFGNNRSKRYGRLTCIPANDGLLRVLWRSFERPIKQHRNTGRVWRYMLQALRHRFADHDRYTLFVDTFGRHIDHTVAYLFCIQPKQRKDLLTLFFRKCLRVGNARERSAQGKTFWCQHEPHCNGPRQGPAPCLINPYHIPSHGYKKDR